jgi:hypothetical protein
LNGQIKQCIWLQHSCYETQDVTNNLAKKVSKAKITIEKLAQLSK